MGIAAVPGYISRHITEAIEMPPGHRFNLFFPYWNNGWEAESSNKTETLKKVCAMPDCSKKLLRALIKRQEELASKFGERALIFPCRLVSPFITGLGNEHPIVNGFSFLTPYGLPYLAGSGIKGVLRHAAELMALFPEEYPSAGTAAITLLDVWWLFGFEGAGCSIWPGNRNDGGGENPWLQAWARHMEVILERKDLAHFIGILGIPDKQKARFKSDPREFLAELSRQNPEFRQSLHSRGALTFWDGFPDCEKMAVEIMTPHYNHYYQEDRQPHDSGQPNPIPFLAVPEGSSIRITVQCDTARLPSSFEWKPQLKDIFTFSNKWQGFGAKTAIGYGAFSLDEAEMGKLEKAAEERFKKARERARLASLSPEQTRIEEFRTAFEKEKSNPYKPGGPFDERRIGFLKEALSWKDPEARKEASRLMAETMKWGTPTKTERKKEFKAGILELEKDPV